MKPTEKPTDETRQPDDFQREQTIFLAVVEVSDPPARRSMLDRLCSGDLNLQQRVELLLAAHETAGSLPPVGASAIPTSVPGAVAGALIAGRYKLLEEIGVGGMGVVWMAEQRSPVRRLVAVKLIKAGMDSRTVVTRFEAERQALAMMDHPNIARVFDGGLTEQGRPYFVMELVRGLPVTQYCDQRRMTVRDRLHLFIQVCDAIQHAHQKGIIHRDIKPTNVLVTEHDGKPVPKVIDFGLAKALGGSGVLTDHTLHTAFGAMAGTPLYTAPEQVAINSLDVDTRADIYALGVLLYELLTGSPPLERDRLKAAAWDEICRVIREEEAPRPSLRISTSALLPSLAASRQSEPAKLSALIKGDLDWIILKALEKQRNRRYDSATSLSADIERHLKDEPVLAAPPTYAYLAGKFAIRYRSGLATAAAIAVVLILGIIVSNWQAIRASRAEVIAKTETLDAQHQRTEAQKQRTEAQKQRDAALEANKKAEAAAATVHRQLADSYTQSGITAWAAKDPSLAAVWFAKALKLDQGDAHRELMDRIRLGDSFRQCVWPMRRADDPWPTLSTGASLLNIRKNADGTEFAVIYSDAKAIKVESNVVTAFQDNDVLITYDGSNACLVEIKTERLLASFSHVPKVDRCFVGPEQRYYVVETWVDDDQGGGYRFSIWDVKTGRQIMQSAVGKLRWVKFSPNGKWIGTANEGRFQVWDAVTLQFAGSCANAGNVELLAISDDGTSILVKIADQKCKVFSTSREQQGPPIDFPEPDYRQGFQLNRDGTRALMQVGPHSYQLADTVTGKLLYYLPLADGDSLDFSKDGQSICGVNLQWDARPTESADELCHPRLASEQTDMVLSPNGKTLITYRDNRLLLWNAETGQPLVPCLCDAPIQQIHFLPDSTKFLDLFVANGKKWLEIRNTSTGQIERKSDVALGLESEDREIKAISPDGEHVLVFSNVQELLFQVFSTVSFQPLPWQITGSYANTPYYFPENFSPDGRALVGLRDGRDLIAWDINTGQAIADPPAKWRAFALRDPVCPDGKSYFSEYDRRFRRVTDNAFLTARVGDDINQAYHAAIGINGEVVMTSTLNGVGIWDSTNAQPVTSVIPGNYLSACAISSDGRSAFALQYDLNSGPWGVVRKCTIAPSEFDASESLSLAELLACRQIDDTAGVIQFGVTDTYNALYGTFLRLAHDHPQYFTAIAPAIPSKDILQSYRDAVETRFAAARTLQEKKALAAEWSLAAVVELYRKRYGEAALLAQTAVSLDDSNIIAQDDLARAYVCMGRFSEALSIYQKHAGKKYHIPDPWNQDRTVGGVIASDISSVWPDGSNNATLQQITDLCTGHSPTPGPIYSDANVSGYAGAAMEQFKLGHIDDAKRSLLKAAIAANNTSNNSDAGRLLRAARAMIDPPSTQPTDDLADGLSTAAWAVVVKPDQTKDKYAYALELATQAVRIQPNADDFDTLGVAQYRMGDYKSAIESLAKSDALDFVTQDDRVPNLAFSALAREKLGQHEQARGLLQKAMQSATEFDDTGELYLAEAIAVIDPANAELKALVAAPPPPPATQPADDTQAATTQPDEPADDARVYAHIAMARFKLGRVEEARELLREATKLGWGLAADSDGGRQIQAAKAMIYPASTQHSDDFASGLDDAASAVVNKPGLPREKYAYALELARRAVEASPDAYGISTMGRAQFRLGDFTAALKSFARSEQVDFASQDQHFANLIFSAMCQQKLGHTAEARVLLAQTLEYEKQMSPNDTGKAWLREAAAMIDPASTAPTTQPLPTKLSGVHDNPARDR